MGRKTKWVQIQRAKKVLSAISLIIQFVLLQMIDSLLQTSIRLTDED